MKQVTAVLLAALMATSACKRQEVRQIDTTYNPVMALADFDSSSTITNPYFPFSSGKTFVYEGLTGTGTERIEFKLLPDTRMILGIECAVVNDKVWVDGKLAEDTYDWYAQDNAGNIWYMGEYVTDYNPDGTVKDHSGSWEAGVDGAKPGIQMLANPQVGMAYRQEYFFNEAEDEAEVVETGLTVTVPFGTFTNCVRTKEWTELDPDVVGYKYYAPGTGLIKENEDVFLIAIEE